MKTLLHPLVRNFTAILSMNFLNLKQYYKNKTLQKFAKLLFKYKAFIMEPF